MKRSRSLFFSTTSQASNSKWMPWELGYKDGHSTRVAILPVSGSITTSNEYKGQEYLGIYPYITQQNDMDGKERLWVRRSATSYIDLENWLAGKEPYER